MTKPLPACSGVQVVSGFTGLIAAQPVFVTVPAKRNPAVTDTPRHTVVGVGGGG
ncbi:MAG: hypothetical protein JWP61_1891 [Friedmanniella sp.]|nr:hypothetical protein [Friedmanniella sp.]